MPSLPALAHAIGMRDHHRGIVGNSIAVERRLQQPPLTQVRRALARKESLAQQSFGPLQAPALGEVLLMRDQDIADVLRVIDEVDALATHPEIDDVAVLARDSRKELERIASGTEERADQRTTRAGRTLGSPSLHYTLPLPCHVAATAYSPAARR